MTMFMHPAGNVDSTRRFPFLPADGTGLSEPGEPIPFFVLLQQLEGAGFGRYGAGLNGGTVEDAAVNLVRESTSGRVSVNARELPQLTGANQELPQLTGANQELPQLTGANRELPQLSGTPRQVQHSGLFLNDSIGNTGWVIRSEASVTPRPFAAILAQPLGAPAKPLPANAVQPGPGGDSITVAPPKPMHEMSVPTSDHAAMNVRNPGSGTGFRNFQNILTSQAISVRSGVDVESTPAAIPMERTSPNGIQTADGNALQAERLSVTAKYPVADQPALPTVQGKTAASENETTGPRNDTVRTLGAAPIVRDLLKNAGGNQDGRQEKIITPSLTAVDGKRVEPAGGQTGTDYQSSGSNRSAGYGEILSLNVQQPNDKSFSAQLLQQTQQTVTPKNVGGAPAEAAIEVAGARSSAAGTVELPRTAMDDIARAMSIRSRDDMSEIRFRLKPDHLGDLVIKVRMEGGRMTAQVDVSHASVKTALEQQLPYLREMLLSRGIDLQRFDIQSGGQSLQSDERGGRHSDRAEGSNKHQPENDSVESYQPKRMLGYNTIEMIV
jgi:flagellar hook-length control protein FliK